MPDDSYFFPVYSGILTPEHRKKIGSALWEFIWCISKTTREIKIDSENLGLVLGGKPIKLSEIANDIGIDRSTVKRNIDKLEKEGYLSLLRAPYGIIIRINKSKKWKKSAVAKTQQEPNKRKFAVAKTQRIRTKLLQKRNARCKNALSNKDIKSDIKKDIKRVVVVDKEPPLQKRNESKKIHSLPGNDKEGMPSSRKDAVPSTLKPDAGSGKGKISESQYRKAVTDKYLCRRAKGFDLTSTDGQALSYLVKNRIPLSSVLDGIDKAFDDHKPKHDLDEIRTLKYCLPIILDLHHARTVVHDKPGLTLQPQILQESKPVVTDTYNPEEDKELQELLAKTKSS